MLFLIRHGETSWNADRRLQGQIDTELNGRGRAQAREAAHTLCSVAREIAGATFMASPLSRTRETLEIMMGELVAMGRLAKPKAYPTDDRLMELSFGRWEGLTWKEVRRNDHADYVARSADIWNVAPPGGESYAQLALRAGPLLASLAPGTAVVTHGGITRVALQLLAGFAPERAAKAPIRQGDVLVFDNGKARWGSGATLGAEED
jgi:broad specificity phosphatase PhoE